MLATYLYYRNNIWQYIGWIVFKIIGGADNCPLICRTVLFDMDGFVRESRLLKCRCYGLWCSQNDPISPRLTAIPQHMKWKHSSSRQGHNELKLYWQGHQTNHRLLHSTPPGADSCSSNQFDIFTAFLIITLSKHDARCTICNGRRILALTKVSGKKSSVHHFCGTTKILWLAENPFRRRLLSLLICSIKWAVKCSIYTVLTFRYIYESKFDKEYHFKS